MGTFTFRSVHNHWHFEDFVFYKLHFMVANIDTTGFPSINYWLVLTVDSGRVTLEVDDINNVATIKRSIP